MSSLRVRGLYTWERSVLQSLRFEFQQDEQGDSWLWALPVAHGYYLTTLLTGTVVPIEGFLFPSGPFFSACSL